MKAKELRGLSKEDLSEKLRSLQKDLMKDNAQVAIGTVPKNPGKLRMTKRTIARIRTILAEDKNNA